MCRGSDPGLLERHLDVVEVDVSNTSAMIEDDMDVLSTGRNWLA